MGSALSRRQRSFKLALTIPEQAEALRISVPQVYKLFNMGDLPSVRIGYRRVSESKTLKLARIPRTARRIH